MHNSSVDLFSDIRAGSPVAPRGREQGIEEAFGLAGLLKDVVMPPESSVEGEAQVVGSCTVGNRVSGHGNCPWGDSASAGEEDNLCLNGIEGKSTETYLIHHLQGFEM